MPTSTNIKALKDDQTDQQSDWRLRESSHFVA